MHDILRYDNEEIKMPPGSTLKDVMVLISKKGKVERRISSIQRIPVRNENIIIWEVTLRK